MTPIVDAATRRRMGDALADAVIAAITALAAEGRHRVAERQMAEARGVPARETAGMRVGSGNWRRLDGGCVAPPIATPRPGDAAPGHLPVGKGVGV